MTQHVWHGQSVTVNPASVAPRPNEVIAGLDPAIHDAVRIRFNARLSQESSRHDPDEELPCSRPH
jgi:hypothetical protein